MLFASLAAFIQMQTAGPQVPPATTPPADTARFKWSAPTTPSVDPPWMPSRAADACRYDTYRANAFACDQIKLGTLRPEFVGSSDAPAWAPTSFSFGFREHSIPRCLVYIAIRIAPTKDITIDWTASTFTVAGIARPVIPGFTKIGRIDQAQRPTAARAGSTIVESVFTGLLDEQSEPICMTTAVPAEIILQLAIAAGGVKDRIEISIDHRATSMTEAEALALVPEPAVDADPGDASPCAFFGIGKSSHAVAEARNAIKRQKDANEAWRLRRRQLGLDRSPASAPQEGGS